MRLRRDFTFDAAHNLVAYHGKCERLHGHTYRLGVTLEGTPDEEGMVLDFVELKRIVREQVLDQMDHAYLNDLVPQPTAENLARWAFQRLDAPLHRPHCRLTSVEVFETADSSVTFYREDLS